MVDAGQCAKSGLNDGVLRGRQDLEDEIGVADELTPLYRGLLRRPEHPWNGIKIPGLASTERTTRQERQSSWRTGRKPPSAARAITNSRSARRLR
jgi:hypothetical protein